MYTFDEELNALRFAVTLALFKIACLASDL